MGIRIGNQNIDPSTWKARPMSAILVPHNFFYNDTREFSLADGSFHTRTSPLEFDEFTPGIEAFFDRIPQSPKEFFAHIMPIRPNHLEAERWAKGKAQNVVAERVGLDLDSRMAGMLSAAIAMYNEEAHGFPFVPPFVGDAINSIIKRIVFDVNPDADYKKKRERGITVSDIFKDLNRHISSGLSPEEAARNVFSGFGLTVSDAEVSRAYYWITPNKKITEKPERKNHLYMNLIDVAETITVLQEGWNVSNIFATQGETAALARLKTVRAKHSNRICKRVEEIFNEEKEDLVQIVRAETEIKEIEGKIKQLKLDGTVESDREISRLETRMEEINQAAYCGRPTEFACRYRGRKTNPLLIKPATRTFSEVMTHLVTIAPLPRSRNEAGVIEEEGDMLLKVAYAVSDRLPVPQKTFHDLHYRDLTRMDGRDMLDAREITRWAIYDLLNQEIGRGERLKNLADWELYQVPALMADWAVVRTILDTDTSLYPEALHGLNYARPEYGGMLDQIYEVLHRTANYKKIKKNLLLLLELYRDSKINRSELPLGRFARGMFPDQIRDSHIIKAAKATPTGYGENISLRALLHAMHLGEMRYDGVQTLGILNPEANDWQGRVAMERVLGPKFWENKGALYNRMAVGLGYEDVWDAVMAGERTLRLVSMLSGGFLAGHFLVNSLFGGAAAANPIALYTFGASSLAWITSKLAAHTFGKEYRMYQWVNVPRDYEWDPSEDLLFTLFLMVNGFSVVWDVGNWVQADGTNNFPLDMQQKLRWQAQNARLMRSFLPWAWAYRNVVGFREAFDAMSPCIFNNFGMATMNNRIGLWSFLALGIPPMLMPHNALLNLPLGTILDLTQVFAYSNYAFIELALRYSNSSNGIPWRGTNWNFGYDKVFVEFNYQNVGRRLWSRFSAQFNITGSLPVANKTDIWGTTPSTASFYLRQVLGSAFINAAAITHVLASSIADGIGLQDIMALTAGGVALWPSLDLFYASTGLYILNDGNEPGSSEFNSMNRNAQELLASPRPPVISPSKKLVYDGASQHPILYDASGNAVAGTTWSNVAGTSYNRDNGRSRFLDLEMILPRKRGFFGFLREIFT